MKKIIAKMTKEEAEDFKKMVYTKSFIMDLLEEAGSRKRSLMEALKRKYNIPPNKMFRVNPDKKIIVEY